MTITPTNQRTVTPTTQPIGTKLHTPSPQRPEPGKYYDNRLDGTTAVVGTTQGVFTRSVATTTKAVDSTSRIQSAANRGLPDSSESETVRRVLLFRQPETPFDEEPSGRPDTAMMSSPTRHPPTANPLASPEAFLGEEPTLRSASVSSLQHAKEGRNLHTPLDWETEKDPVILKPACAATAAASMDTSSSVQTPAVELPIGSTPTSKSPQDRHAFERAAGLRNISEMMIRTLKGYNPENPPAAWVALFPAISQNAEATSPKVATQVDPKADDKDLEDFLEQLRVCGFKQSLA